MHLSRLLLDPQATKARRDLAYPYEMHRTLVRAFVQDEQQTPPRFLWRLETHALWSQPTVLVQSSHSADWSHVEQLTGYLQNNAIESKRIDLNTLLKPDARYRFRLLANPTVTRNGKRHGLVGDSEQLSWLQRQGERYGFGLNGAMITASDVLHARKGKTQISLRRVCYEGILQAHDTNLLSQASTNGIGPGKALGCGLLSLARC